MAQSSLLGDWLNARLEVNSSLELVMEEELLPYNTFSGNLLSKRIHNVYWAPALTSYVAKCFSLCHWLSVVIKWISFQLYILLQQNCISTLFALSLVGGIDKVIHSFNAIPIKIPIAFLRIMEKLILKFMWNCKRPWIAKIMLKKNKRIKSEDAHFLTLKLTKKLQ